MPRWYRFRHQINTGRSEGSRQNATAYRCRSSAGWSARLQIAAVEQEAKAPGVPVLVTVVQVRLVRVGVTNPGFAAAGCTTELPGVTFKSPQMIQLEQPGASLAGASRTLGSGQANQCVLMCLAEAPKKHPSDVVAAGHRSW